MVKKNNFFKRFLLGKRFKDSKSHLFTKEIIKLLAPLQVHLGLSEWWGRGAYLSVERVFQLLFFSIITHCITKLYLCISRFFPRDLAKNDGMWISTKISRLWNFILISKLITVILSFLWRYRYVTIPLPFRYRFKRIRYLSLITLRVVWHC